jgi:hypothetical protein
MPALKSEQDLDNYPEFLSCTGEERYLKSAMLESEF